jgi:hypothetical protein
VSNPVPKFLFDECALGTPAFDALANLLRFAEPESNAVLEHKLRFHDEGPGVWDEIWIPRAGQEGWIVISADRGKKGGKRKGEKLPRVCVAHRVTHVLMSSGVKSQKQFDQLLIILSVWYHLLETAAASPGTCFSLEPLERGRGILRVKNAAVPVPESSPEPSRPTKAKPKQQSKARRKSKKKDRSDKRQRPLFEK